MSVGLVKLTLYARVGDSEVLNDIGTISIQGTTEPIPEGHEGAPSGARVMVTTNLAAALRQAADEIEKQATR